MRQSKQSAVLNIHYSTVIKSGARKPRGGPRISRITIASRRLDFDRSKVAVTIARRGTTTCGCVLISCVVAASSVELGAGGAADSCT